MTDSPSPSFCSQTLQRYFAYWQQKLAGFQFFPSSWWSLQEPLHQNQPNKHTEHKPLADQVDIWWSQPEQTTPWQAKPQEQPTQELQGGCFDTWDEELFWKQYKRDCLKQNTKCDKEFNPVFKILQEKSLLDPKFCTPSLHKPSTQDDVE